MAEYKLYLSFEKNLLVQSLKMFQPGNVKLQMFLTFLSLVCGL